MVNVDTSKEQLIGELELLRRRVAEIEKLEAERKRVEGVLRESEKPLRTLFDNVLDGILILDYSGKVLNLNSILAKMFDLESVDEVIGINALEFILPEFHDIVLKDLVNVKEGRGGYLSSYKVRSALGREFWVEGLGTDIIYEGKHVDLVCIRDITERKQTEEKIKRAAEEWRTTFDSIADLVSIQNKDYKLVRVNKAFADAFKMKPVELIGKPCYEMVHGTKEPMPDCPHQQTLETKQVAMAEFFEPHLGIHLQVSTSPIFNENGEVVSSVHITRDITERKRMEEALRENGEKLRLMFESVTEGITVSDLEGNIIQVNEAVVRLHGYDNKEELIGRSALELIVEKDHVRAIENLKKTLGEGYSGTIEYTFLTKDGREFPAELSAAVLRDASGNPTGFIAITRDITEHKEMEQQLILTDRLASVGELASGIAHELNNPLTGVIGFSQLLLNKDVPDDVKLDLKIIYSEAQRAAEVVKGLLTFARKHAPVKQPVNIDSIIEKVLALRSYEQRVNNIQVNTHSAPDLPRVMADYFQLQQVFLNIIINAEYFMVEAHGEGTLTIITEKVGDIIKTSFTDDGPGINQENLGHLFDPFFTTKEVGKGTGLGLSICHGIITEHDGRIYVESELGKGATFVVELPVSDH